MTKEDYREKIEEDRQEIELETTKSRMSRSTGKIKKRKSPLMPTLLVIFIFIPLLVLIYTQFIYEPTSPVETVEQTNDVVQVEKNEPPVVAEAADDEEEEDEKKDGKATSEKLDDVSEEQKKELAAAQAAAAAEATKAAQEKAAAEQKAKEEAKKKAEEEAKRQAEEAAKSKKTHTVQSNETLYRIAMNYYNDPNAVEKIKKANGLNSESIYVGQTLVLP
ncbi:LysM peptidoglycan-binding domain-containing protein [Lysinibacillus sp. KU-BSD001]|uniref:LysM peptidoglycan-binding domain-containing protein n=1 Tax=Lysinibacillus sp. KU-BSD001 TaxID=3141328 RepID=UPI0036E732AC